MDKKLFKSILFIIAYSVLLVAVIINIEWIFNTTGWLLGLLSPIFIGFATAFILNRPYMLFLKLYSTPIKRKKTKAPKKPQKPRTEKTEQRVKKLKKALSLLTVYILFLALIALLLWLVIPEITNSLSQISSNIEDYIKNLNNLLSDFEDWLPFDLSFTDPILSSEEVSEGIAEGTETKISISQFLTQKLTELTSALPTIVSGFLPNLFHITKSVASSITNILLGLIMSVYMLASKDSLLSQCRHFFDAFAPKKLAKKTYEVLAISSDVFSNFVSGRLYDALIVGMLCFVGMSIFNFQYTLLISVIVAVTNVIPIFGPFIGAIPSIFLLLLVDPMQAVWFTVFIIVLQQIDGNLIGPKVVGDSIGLPAWWVMVSILIGGGMLGVFGMLAGVPTFAVVYKMLKKTIHERLVKKGLESVEESTQNG
ncbi:MAG: AI-2E family transporter [Clostridia bacterium]|nr:AI-2E family transporter [Clostridia bacterium]